MSHDKFIKLGRIFLAETIGTAILLFIGCLGCVDKYEYFNPSHKTISIGAGLALMIGINSFDAISGAHINPAVTLAALVYKTINIVDSFVYLIAQMLGAILGYSIVRILIQSEYTSDPGSFCMNLPLVDSGKAVAIEFIITFILMCVVCAVWDPKNVKFQDSASLRIGLTVSILVFISGKLSGGSMNPARSFGPAFYNSNWKYHWIYWVGPLSGSFTAAVLFKKILMDTDRNKIIKKCFTDGAEVEQLEHIK